MVSFDYRVEVKSLDVSFTEVLSFLLGEGYCGRVVDYELDVTTRTRFCMEREISRDVLDRINVCPYVSIAPMRGSRDRIDIKRPVAVSS